MALVCYPATLAPAVVTTQCADNATPTTSLSVTCRSDGSWSGSPLTMLQPLLEESLQL